MAWYVSFELKNQKHNLEEFCKELMTKIEDSYDEDMPLRRFDCGIYNGVIWAETRHLSLNVDIYMELNEGSLVGARLYNREEYEMVINPEYFDEEFYDPFQSDPFDLYTQEEINTALVSQYMYVRPEIIGTLSKDDIILDYIEEHGITIKDFFTNKLKQI